MKYTNLLTVMVMALMAMMVSFSSCNKDDEDGPLEGTWIVKNEDGTVFLKIEFSGENFTYTMEKDDPIKGTYKCEGNKLTLSMGGIPFLSYEYKVEDNKLYLYKLDTFGEKVEAPPAILTKQ